MDINFQYTTEGYTLAKDWLIDIGREDILTNGFSIDGWSVVAAANTIWNNRNAKGRYLVDQMKVNMINEKELLGKYERR